MGSMSLAPSSIETPATAMASPPRENTMVWWPEIRPDSAEAPRAIGRMTAPTPAAKTRVMPTIWVRRRKVEAK